MSQEQEIETAQDVADVSQETPPKNVFIAPSIAKDDILSGHSYSHSSPIPDEIAANIDTACVLGVDEAGRGPVLGPMVYSLFYLPLEREKPLLANTHKFNDSKALTPQVRSNLMRALCTPDSDLHKSCGWAARVMSARDISAGMLRSSGAYNLNNQAMDATIDLIQAVCDRGVNVQEIYVDTIGRPERYQKKLERVFPAKRITVAKKADSLYPCVSAASICAKVTRDAALEVSYAAYQTDDVTKINGEASSKVATEGWGSGYPSDGRCTSWMKRNMDPVFGWGPECRFGWATAKDMIELKNPPCSVDWPEPDEIDDSMKVTSYFNASSDDTWQERGELANWFGTPATNVAV